MISVPELVTSSLQARLLSEDPIRFIYVLKETILQNGNSYIIQSIGNFGWIDTPLSWAAVIGILFFIAAVVWKAGTKGKTHASVFTMLMCIVLPIVSALYIFYFFYTVGTPVGASTITSVQGRYFFPLLLFFIYGVYLLLIRLGKWKAKIVCGIGAFFIMTSCLLTLYNRYYNYSKVFAEPDVLIKLIEENTIDVKESPYIEVRKTISIPLPSKTGYKLAGFQLVVHDRGEEIAMSVPYGFILKDETGNIMMQGFLDLMDIQYPGVRTKTFQPIRITSTKVILDLMPLVESPNNRYLELVREADLPRIHPLYLSQ